MSLPKTRFARVTDSFPRIPASFRVLRQNEISVVDRFRFTGEWKQKWPSEEGRAIDSIYLFYSPDVPRCALLHMEAGVANHVWTVEEIVALLEPKSMLDGIKQKIVDSN